MRPHEDYKTVTPDGRSEARGLTDANTAGLAAQNRSDVTIALPEGQAADLVGTRRPSPSSEQGETS